MNRGRLLSVADDAITERPRRVVVLFLLLTVVFGLGLGNVSTETGTEQFTVGVPEERALEDVEREFGAPFEADDSTTQLVQRGTNVVSKPGVLRMLRVQERVLARPDLRVRSTTSAARLVATELDPTATTVAEQVRVVERATDAAVRRAVRARADDPRFTALLSTDFSPRAASASATIGIVEHDLPVGESAGAGQSATSPLTTIQERTAFVAGTVDGDVTVFGSGVVAAEFGRVVSDSLLLVVPASVVLIVVCLVLAYRDLVDLLLGVVALGMAIVWTFGFMGLAGIAFSQFLIAVPPLLLSVGVDFGIHAVNRYREEYATDPHVETAMRRTTHQLLVAFAIVTGTTVVGFLANLSSQLVPIRDFGVVASVGIVFTFLVFGVYLPASKVWVDEARERYPIPTFSRRPLGGTGGVLEPVLLVGVAIAKRTPALFLVAVLVVSAIAGSAATDLDTDFSTEDFLPPERTPAALASLPEPFRPSEYTITATTNFLESTFEAAEDDTTTVYVEGPLARDTALESIARVGQDPPDSFVRRGRRAESTSIVTVVQSYANEDPAFARLVARHDGDGNGIPDDDLSTVYEALLSSPARASALDYLTADYRSARVVYTVKATADDDAVTADTRTMADRHRVSATATGGIVVFQAVADIIFESALVSLGLALSGTAVFLLLVYALLERRPLLGVVNLVPILVTVALLVGTMAVLDVAFNAFTATVLAITIGLGVDYSVHLVHRYADERRVHDRDVALSRTMRGTGGALAGSVATTAGGIGVLVLAVFPAIGQFGFLTAVSVFYSFLTAILVLPSALVLWDRYRGPGDRVGPHGE